MKNQSKVGEKEKHPMQMQSRGAVTVRYCTYRSWSLLNLVQVGPANSAGARHQVAGTLTFSEATCPVRGSVLLRPGNHLMTVAVRLLR